MNLGSVGWEDLEVTESYCGHSGRHWELNINTGTELWVVQSTVCDVIHSQVHLNTPQMMLPYNINN